MINILKDKGIVKPHDIAISYDYSIFNDNIEYVVDIKNLNKSFANTIGNILNKLILDNMPGIAIYAFKITDLNHLYDYSVDIKEDASQISLNIRDVILYYKETESIIIDKSISKSGNIYINDIISDNQYNIQAYKNTYLFHKVNEKKINIYLYINNGVGYVSHTEHDELCDIAARKRICINSLYSHTKDLRFIAEPNISYNLENLQIKFNVLNIYNNIEYPIKNMLKDLLDLCNLLNGLVSGEKNHIDNIKIILEEQSPEIKQFFISQGIKNIHELYTYINELLKLESSALKDKHPKLRKKALNEINKSIDFILKTRE